jgi:hypothetical protein
MIIILNATRRPGMTVLDVFRPEYEAWMVKVHPELEQPVVGVKQGHKKAPKEHKSRYSSFKPTVETRA